MDHFASEGASMDRFAALVPKPEPELTFLRQLLTEAQAEFLYSSAALWCSDAGIDSAEALRRNTSFCDEFCSQLLSITAERLKQVLGPLGPASKAVSSTLSEASPKIESKRQEDVFLDIASQAPDVSGHEESSVFEQRSSISRSESVGVGVAPTAELLQAVDTTGDGLVDSVGLDTTGDGNVDTVQKLVFRAAPKARTYPHASLVCAQTHAALDRAQDRVAAKRGSLDEKRQWLANAFRRGDAGLDTTGDGLVDSVGLDTTGDGQVDTLRPLNFAPEHGGSKTSGLL